MFETTEKPPRARTGWLAIIMFGLLVAAVGVAWWLAQGRQEYTHLGERIVREFQKDGLAKAMGQQPAARLYLVTFGDKVLGWSAIIREPVSGGGFTGLNVMILPKTQNWKGSNWEHWILNANATGGQYLAGDLELNYHVLQPVPDTRIEFEGKQIKVWQRRLQLPSAGTIPANYLPEGTLLAASMRVAQEKGHAYFSLIYNTEILPARGPGQTLVTQYGLANVEYRETVKVNGVEAAAVDIRRGVLGREEDQTYYLDAQGLPIKITSGEVEHAAVSPAELQKAFPEAPKMLAELAAQQQMELPASLFGQAQPQTQGQ